MLSLRGYRVGSEVLTGEIVVDSNPTRNNIYCIKYSQQAVERLTVMVLNSIQLSENNYFSVEFRHSTRNASRIRLKVRYLNF